MAERIRYTETVPEWAQDLALEVYVYEGMDATPHISWHTSKHPGTSGYTREHRGNIVDPRIQISAGSLFESRYETLLHELAHAVVPSVSRREATLGGEPLMTNQGHTAVFWDKVFELVATFPLPGRTPADSLSFAYMNERDYRKGATPAAARAGVPLAISMVEARRDRARREREVPSCGGRDHFSGLIGALTPVEGIPMVFCGEVGMYSFAAERTERCRRCGWQGRVYRPNLRYDLWNPKTGSRWG